MFGRRPIETGFDPGPGVKLANAVAFLANHAPAFGLPDSDSRVYGEGSTMDAAPPEVAEAIHKAVVAAARYVEQVFIEGV